MFLPGTVEKKIDFHNFEFTKKGLKTDSVKNRNYYYRVAFEMYFRNEDVSLMNIIINGVYISSEKLPLRFLAKLNETLNVSEFIKTASLIIINKL